MQSIFSRQISIIAAIAVFLFAAVLSFGLAEQALAADSADNGAKLTADSGLGKHIDAQASRPILTARAKDVNWTGSVVKPKLTVKCGKKKLKAGRDYKAIYPKSKKVGYHEVKIVGKGKYAKAKKTSAGYYVLPHARELTSYSVEDNTLDIEWTTYPDGTSQYAFVLSPTAKGIKNKWTIGDEMEGKWDSGAFFDNDDIKSKWGAGHASLDIKKYMSSAYKKNYVYLCIVPLCMSDGFVPGKATVKKVHF